MGQGRHDRGQIVIRQTGGKVVDANEQAWRGTEWICRQKLGGDFSGSFLAPHAHRIFKVDQKDIGPTGQSFLQLFLRIARNEQ